MCNLGTPEDWLRLAAVYVLIREYNPSGRYGAFQKEDILLTTNYQEGGEGT